jgi:hypothetical protein
MRYSKNEAPSERHIYGRAKRNYAEASRPPSFVAG